jgi:hypothetical protein
MELRVYYHVYKSLPLVPVPSQMNSVDTLPPDFLKIVLLWKKATIQNAQVKTVYIQYVVKLLHKDLLTKNNRRLFLHWISVFPIKS